jgi:hypothetical protein
MQNDWQTEINQNFAELKEREKVRVCVLALWKQIKRFNFCE